MTELTRAYKLTDSGAWGWVTEEAEGGGGGSLPSWWTVDSTPGAESVTFNGEVIVDASASGDVSAFHVIPPPVGGGPGYVPFRIERPGGSSGFNEDFFNIEYDGMFVIVPPGEGDDFYMNLQGNVNGCRYYTGKITDGTLSFGVIRWGTESGVDNATLAFFNGEPVVQPTGVAVDVAAMHAACVALNLFTA